MVDEWWVWCLYCFCVLYDCDFLGVCLDCGFLGFGLIVWVGWRLLLGLWLLYFGGLV